MRRQRRHTGCTARLEIVLPPDVKESLRAAAASEGVTLGRLIVGRLVESLEFRKVCKWCKPPRVTDGRGPILEGESVSHTICEDCTHKERAKL